MKTIKLLSAIVALFMLFSCGSNTNTESKGKVKIAYVNWIECIANTNLSKAVLEARGYEVEIINADVAPIFAAVANGDADLFLEVWEPVTHKDYMERFGDDLEKIGTVYSEGKIGLVVPEYLTINSLEELEQHNGKFNGKIIGINPGAGMMGLTNDVIDAYELDFELVTSSEAGMLATLKREYDRDNWVVVTGWKPHTKFAKWDLKILEDPKKIFGETETLSIYATKGWSEKNPELATFFSNFKMNDENMGTLMIAIENNPGNETEAAKEWYMNHKELVDSWFDAN